MLTTGRYTDAVVQAGDQPITKVCTRCSREYETHVLKIGVKIWDWNAYCEPCSMAIRAEVEETKSGKRKAAMIEKWHSICPEYYRTDQIRKAIPPTLLASISDSIKSGKGCLVVGQSGNFKSTAVYHALKHAISRGQSVLAITGMEWRDLATKASQSDSINSLDKYAKSKWLFFDDLGNMGITQSSAVALQSLLERRKGALLPVIFTTQYSGAKLEKALADKAGPELAEAIVRRVSVVSPNIIQA